MSDDQSTQQVIIDDQARLIVENYCIIASSALLWFDFALNLPNEYRRIWSRKFTGATVVYLLMRYAAVIERIFFVLEVLVWNSSDRVSQPSALCGGITHSDDVLLIINYLAFSAFTVLRVYGVWGRDWRPLLVVLPISLVKPLVVAYENAHYTPLQAGPPFGCVYIWELPDATLSAISIIAKATTIAADSILIVLTWIKTFGIQRDALKTGFRTPVATLLLRDGKSIITIISNQELTIWLVWPYFDQVITVIFLSRFMLDLRGLYFASRHGREAETTFHISDLHFAGHVSSTIVGNLGATLSAADPAPSHNFNSSKGSETAVGTGNGEASPVTPSSAASETDVRDRDRGRYAWEWDEDEDDEEFCDDPFGVGMRDAGKPPALVSEETIEMDEVEKQESPTTVAEIEEEKRLGDGSPV
ncbi:hypothetical protein C8Q77DRAFT_1220240 [Trametes polyzona]|nr:hypothetical protein C8Q77DRAFT_1220240 [Trametes polyzona]